MAARPGRAQVSVLYPFQVLHADLLVPFAKVAIDGGAGRLWTGQSGIVESHQAFAFLAGAGFSLPVGLGVTLMPLRHPYEAAIQARSLALLTGHPVVVGYGAATPGLVAALRGAPYDRPAKAAAGYAKAVRELLDAGPSASLLRLPPVRHPGVEVGLGVLRPGMARAAGAVADVAVTWMTPPGYVREVLAPALAEGAVGRNRPPRIATVVHVCVARRGRDPRRLALAAAGGHLSAPHYADMLRQAGIAVDHSNPTASVAALVDAGVYAYGTPAEIAKCISSYHEAGVDEVILNTAGAAATEQRGAAVADLYDVLAATREASSVGTAGLEP